MRLRECGPLQVGVGDGSGATTLRASFGVKREMKLAWGRGGGKRVDIEVSVQVVVRETERKEDVLAAWPQKVEVDVEIHRYGPCVRERR